MVKRFDELYPIAVQLVIRISKKQVGNPTASVSSLQRLMGIGYSLSQELLARMESEKIIKKHEQFNYFFVLKKRIRLNLTKKQQQTISDLHTKFNLRNQFNVRLARAVKRFVERSISQHEGFDYKHNNATFLKRGYALENTKWQGQIYQYSLYKNKEFIDNITINEQEIMKDSFIA